jgi:UDP-N-acetylenolpyruvoylglucosamine reductase
MAVPSTWSRSPPENPRPAAQEGEHSREVLAEAGYSGADIEALIDLAQREVRDRYGIELVCEVRIVGERA